MPAEKAEKRSSEMIGPARRPAPDPAEEPPPRKSSFGEGIFEEGS
jgi:hypothetical protein